MLLDRAVAEGTVGEVTGDESRKMTWPDDGDIPDTPGVYTFWGRDGEALYVGKSSRLRRRITGYRNGRLHGNMHLVLDQAHQLTWITLSTSEEALWVEANLIATVAPRYNIRARTNPAPYPYVLVTGGDIPRIGTWRSGQPRHKGDRRYGPFPGQARALVNTLAGTFGLRPCSDAKLRQHQRMKRACLLGDTGKCSAPCLTTEGYRERVQQAVDFLNGDTSSAVRQITQAMEQAAADRKFEHAGMLRDRIDALSCYQRARTLADSRGRVDAIGIDGDELGWVCVTLHTRDGILLGTSTVEIDAVGDHADTTTALLTGAARTWARSEHGLPERVLSEDDARLSALLGFLTPTGELPRTKRGDSAGERLRAAAAEAAHQALAGARRARLADTGSRSREIGDLSEALGTTSLWRVECLDISHWAGTSTVAGLSVLIDAIPDGSAECSWDLPDSADDYASIRHAVAMRLEGTSRVAGAQGAEARRTSRGSSRRAALETLPDLLLIDGGPMQVAAAMEVVREHGVALPIAGLAKRLEEVWLPDADDPLILPRDNAGLYLLQRARDRAHRVAITRQRFLRRRALLKGDLQGVPGLGARRRERLFAEAGGIEALLGSEASELKRRFPWLPEDVCEGVARHCALPTTRAGAAPLP